VPVFGTAKKINCLAWETITTSQWGIAVKPQAPVRRSKAANAPQNYATDLAQFCK